MIVLIKGPCFLHSPTARPDCTLCETQHIADRHSRELLTDCIRCRNTPECIYTKGHSPPCLPASEV